ncbi:MAG: phosphatase PAP2 family protein [Zetaproteobacteria bacterium]|nr:phosphatase PAP2 family protein [Zetaproteobacteria bacterium]
MGVVSGLGDGLVVALLLSMVMLFHLRLGVAGLAAFLLSGLLAQILKRLFDMPRPAALFDDVHVLGHVLTTHSFPSGHATSCGVMMVLAFLLWGRDSWWARGAAALFALAAYGRIYGGVHFPLDVAVGLLLGTLSMVFCWRASSGWIQAHWLASEWAWKIPGIILIIEAAVLGLGYRIQPATAVPLVMVLPVVSLMVLMQAWKGRIGNKDSF